MVFVTPPKIYCGEKTREKNWKFQDRTNHLYISGSNNYFAAAKLGTIYATEKYLIVNTFKMDQKIYMQFCAGVSL